MHRCFISQMRAQERPTRERGHQALAIRTTRERTRPEPTRPFALELFVERRHEPDRPGLRLVVVDQDFKLNLRAGTKAIAYVWQVWGKAVALLRFEPPTDGLKSHFTPRCSNLQQARDKRHLMSSLAETHHSDKEKIYCMPNAAWMKHLSEWS
jgi:hypothetical protein